MSLLYLLKLLYGLTLNKFICLTTFHTGCHNDSKNTERSDIITWPSEEQGGFLRCTSMNILKSGYIPLPVLL